MKILVTTKQIDGAPAEFQVLPYGTIQIEGDESAHLDEAAMKSIIAAFDRRGNDMVIDYEHQTLGGGQAPAAGWIKKFIDKGKEGLWAVVEWTDRAKEYLKNKEYRYFSPVMWVAKEGRRVAKIENVALTNFPKVNNLKPIMAKMSLDEARMAREERSKKYGIALKDGGNVSKPSEWEGVPDDEWLDPVNYRYPCPDAAQTRAAASYWGQSDNQAQYTPEERAKMNARLDKFREKFGIGQQKKEVANMLEKLRKLLGLAADAAEDKVTEAVVLLVNKSKQLETVVACKEVLDALGAKADATKEQVVLIVGSLKAPADVAVKLSQDVARLTKELSEIKQAELVQLALKEGKTSPDELDKWGRDLALKNPEQFKLIVLSRPAGSVIPVGGLPPKDPAKQQITDEVQLSINKMMGITDETWKKYNPVTH